MDRFVFCVYDLIWLTVHRLLHTIIMNEIFYFSRFKFTFEQYQMMKFAIETFLFIQNNEKYICHGKWSNIYIGKLCLTFYYNKHDVEFAELEYIRISNENKNIDPKTMVDSRYQREYAHEYRYKHHANCNINQHTYIYCLMKRKILAEANWHKYWKRSNNW